MSVRWFLVIALIACSCKPLECKEVKEIASCDAAGACAVKFTDGLIVIARHPFPGATMCRRYGPWHLRSYWEE